MGGRGAGSFSSSVTFNGKTYKTLGGAKIKKYTKNDAYRIFVADKSNSNAKKLTERYYRQAMYTKFPVVNKIPKGWHEVEGAQAPLGYLLISNGKSFFSNNRESAYISLKKYKKQKNKTI